MPTDISQYKTLYITTAKDLITTMKSEWEKLNKNNADTTALSELHRAAHSLKSQSLVMGYPQTGLLNKHLEMLLRECKEGTITLTQPLIDMIQRIITSADYALDKIKNNQGEPDLNPQIKELSEIIAQHK